MSSPIPPPGADAGAGGAAPPAAAPPPPSGSPAAAGPGMSPFQAQQSSPSQMIIAQMYQICRRMEMENPQMAPGLRKACEGLQEAQTAQLMNRPQTTPPEQNPPY